MENVKSVAEALDSDDYQKTEMEMLRDARIAELAVHLQPVQAAAQEFATSMQKSRPKRQTALSTRKSTRVRKEETRLDESSKPLSEIACEPQAGKGILEVAHVPSPQHMSDTETNTNDSDSSEEGIQNMHSEEDNVDVHEGTYGNRNKRSRYEVPPQFTAPPSLHVGFPRESQQVPTGQWQWVTPQWMPPQPIQPPPWAMAAQGVPPSTISWQMHADSQEVSCRPDSAARSYRRKKRRESDNESVARMASGKKPNEVHVTPSGEIDGSCLGKNAWDQSVRAFVPLILDISVVEWKKHKPETLKKLRDSLDADFEYVGNTLSNKGFRNAVKRFLKCERSRLKKQFKAGLLDCPVHVDLPQWEKLKSYWAASRQVKKSETMANVRKQVQNVSKAGRRGKAGREADMAKEKERSPGLSEIAEGLRKSEAAGSSAVSSGASTRMDALESRQDDFEKFKVDILASTNRTTEVVETLKNALMQFLQKGNIGKDDEEVEGGNDKLATKTVNTDVFAGSDLANEVKDPYEMDVIDRRFKPQVHEQSFPEDHGNNIVVLEDEVVKRPVELQRGKDREPCRKSKRVESKKILLQHTTGKDIGKQNPTSTIGREASSQKPPAKMQPTQKAEPKKKPKLPIGRHVSLLNPSDPDERVAFGQVIAIGGGPAPPIFHGKPIPPGWYRIVVHTIQSGLIPLMQPNENGDQYQLKDVVGGNTLWDENYVINYESQ